MINNAYTNEELTQTLADCERLVDEYKTFISIGDSDNQGSLNEYRHRFNISFLEISKCCAYVYKLRTSRDDKSLTQKKAKIAKEIIGTKINDEFVTFSKADKIYAAASDKYKELIEEREVYYEAFLLFRSMQEVIRMFSNEIAKRIG